MPRRLLFGLVGFVVGIHLLLAESLIKLGMYVLDILLRTFLIDRNAPPNNDSYTLLPQLLGFGRRAALFDRYF